MPCEDVRHYRIIQIVTITDNHRRLGELLKERRNALGLTLENVSAKIQVRGHKLSPQHLSNLETAYSRPGKEPATPPDDLLNILAQTLDLPIRSLHAALGRAPSGSPASQLVREKLAAYNGEGQIAPAVLDDLSSEVDDFAQVRVERVMRQVQGDGKQLQTQK